MATAHRDACIIIDFRWKKRLIDINKFLQMMQPKVFQAATIIKNQAAWMASGASLRSGLPLGDKRVRVDTGNYRRLMFVNTKIVDNGIRAELGSAAVDTKGTAYPKYVEGYTKNFQLSMYEKWKEAQQKIFSSVEKIIGSGSTYAASKF